MDPIQSKLIYVDTRELFDTLHTAGAFRNLSIVFIGSSLEIWTHGVFIGSAQHIQKLLIWQQNTKADDGYVLKSGTVTDAYWGVPQATIENEHPDPQWITFSKWDINHGGTNKNTSDWATLLTAAGINDIVLVSKTTGDNPVVSFSTLGTTDIDNNNNRQILVNDVNGVRWYNESLLDVNHANSASSADQLNHYLGINGYVYNGSEDIDTGIIDIMYGGTSKTAFQPTGVETHAWFEQSEFDVNTTSYKNKLVTIYGESNGTTLTDITFNTTDIPTLAIGEYALVNTPSGLTWTDLGVYLQATSAMVFKGTVNCNIAAEITDENITPKPIDWYGAETGWTYMVTDRSFEVVLSGDGHGSYGQVDTRDLLICLSSATDTQPAQWAIVQNKITDGVVYVGQENPLLVQQWPEGTGSQVSYVALSYGTEPTQIHYYQNGTDGLWIDADGWLHGKFYGPGVGAPGEETNYAKWITESEVIHITSASSGSATNILTSLSNNAIRLSMDDYGNFVYASPTIWDTGSSGSATIFHMFQLTQSGSTYSSSVMSYSTINSMTTGQTKTVAIGSLMANGGFIGGNGTTMKLVAHNEYRDISASAWNQMLYSSSQNNSFTSEAATKAQSNPEIVLTLTKVAGGFTIQNKDGLYLNCSVNDDTTDFSAGGSVYNPIYIDTEGITRSTDIYSYNIMKQYTGLINSSWSSDSLNPYYDSIYGSYLNGETAIGYSKNLIIPVVGATKLISADDNLVRTGAILQWSNSTNSITNNILLFGDNTRNEFYFRTQSGENWGDWCKIASASDYYTKQEIDDTELVIARALTNLDLRVTDITNEFNDLDLIVSQALTNLNERITALENGSGQGGSYDIEDDFGEGHTGAFTNYYTKDEIDYLEYGISTALNTLNNRSLETYTKEEINLKEEVIASSLVDLKGSKLNKLTLALLSVLNNTTATLNQINNDIDTTNLNSDLITEFRTNTSTTGRITIVDIINYLYDRYVNA